MKFPWAEKLQLRKIRLPGLRKGKGVYIGGIWISDQARLRHTHIIGATGSGKTVLLEQLIAEDIRRGQGMVVIDPKGDRELFERVRAECAAVGRLDDLKFLSAVHREESGWWNPCGLGDESELQSKFYNSAIYSEPHYAKWCERALLEVFNRLVQQQRLNGFSLRLVTEELEKLKKEQVFRNENVEGLLLDLFNLGSGEWAAPLGCGSKAPDRSREISLLDVTQKNQILFVDLPTEAKKVQSSRIGRLLTQELMLISGLRKMHPGLRGDRPFSVYIDEFDAFATESFATFLNKARSSDFMIHVAHQTLSDLNAVSEDFSGKVLGNCNVRFFFRQDDPDDAERLSRFIGTRMTVKKTYQTQDGSHTGASSNREVQEFVLPPDQIKRLKVGQCFVSIKTDAVARLVRLPFSKASKTTGVPLPDFQINQRGVGVAASPPPSGALLFRLDDEVNRAASE